MYVDSVRRVHNTKKTLAHLSLHVGMYIYYRYTAVDIVFVFIQLGRKLAGWQHHLCLLNDGPIKSPLVWLWRWRYNRVNISTFRQAQKIRTPSHPQCFAVFNGGTSQSAGPAESPTTSRRPPTDDLREPIIFWPSNLTYCLQRHCFSFYYFAWSPVMRVITSQE